MASQFLWLVPIAIFFWCIYELHRMLQDEKRMKAEKKASQEAWDAFKEKMDEQDRRARALFQDAKKQTEILKHYGSRQSKTDTRSVQ